MSLAKTLRYLSKGGQLVFEMAGGLSLVSINQIYVKEFPLYIIFLSNDLHYLYDRINRYSIVQLGLRSNQSLSLKVWTKDEH